MKKTIALLLAMAGMASATELQELFYTTNYNETIDLSTAGLGSANNFTFVLTLDPKKLGSLAPSATKNPVFQVETGVAYGMGIVYWSDTPQFSMIQGAGTIPQATTALPAFSWDDVAGVALTLTTQENDTRDKFQLHAYIVGNNGKEILNTSYTEKTISNRYNPVVFGMVNMTELIQSAAGYKGTASPSEALAMAKAAVSGETIPEPTTATLSLLALAGLAARRRRK